MTDIGSSLVMRRMLRVCFDDSYHDGRGCYDDGCHESYHPYHLHEDCHHSHRLHHCHRDCYHHLFLLYISNVALGTIGNAEDAAMILIVTVVILIIVIRMIIMISASAAW